MYQNSGNDFEISWKDIRTH